MKETCWDFDSSRLPHMHKSRMVAFFLCFYFYIFIRRLSGPRLLPFKNLIRDGSPIFMLPSSPPPPLNLIMECDNPFNTNMYDEKDGRILYQVMTEYSESMTRVVNIEGATIASWHWRDPRQETITFGNGHPVFLGSWLKKSIMPFKDSVTFQDQSGHHFKWKGWGTGQWPLELFAEDDRKTPIAWFVKSWATSSGSQRPKARLPGEEQADN
ncbi:hypothetical protein D9757_001440 [Collybiopsis confluens]|uniref:DUF6593 domain-containing protein n=1 Tax=Collybiopsis confluens TaxID=2823264 RepID=A0A8H5HZL5_9AGAR|nr:hypothetical protein D9757_001440 [Collybiopsis confluens]